MKSFSICGLLALIFSSLAYTTPAAAKALATTERQVVEILKDTMGPRAKNPIFRCYHLGRLQGVADRLASDIARISTRKSKNPTKQAQLIYAGQVLHLKLEKRLATWAYDCDPALSRREQLKAMAHYPVEQQVQIARKQIRGIGAEDPVIGCFQAGRLEVLTDRLQNNLRREAAQGARVSERTLSLLNEASAAIRKHARDCDRF